MAIKSIETINYSAVLSSKNNRQNALSLSRFEFEHLHAREIELTMDERQKKLLSLSAAARDNAIKSELWANECIRVYVCGFYIRPKGRLLISK